MNKITQTLLLLGMKPSMKGFAIIVEALKLINKDEEILHNLTKCLYPEVAEKFKDATDSTVERNIRHIIEKSIWETDLWADIFFVKDGKRITNGHFLAAVNLYLKENRKSA